MSSNGRYLGKLNFFAIFIGKISHVRLKIPMLAEFQAWCCGGRQACDLRHGHGQVAAQPSTLSVSGGFHKWRYAFIAEW
jgi:hypothetical protein